MTQEMTKAQDLITAVEGQRNFLATQLAHATADLMSANRRIAELESQMALLKATPPAKPDATAPNGAPAGDHSDHLM